MRKIKQIAVDSHEGGSLIALCEDGTLWQKYPRNATWYPITGIPQEQELSKEKSPEIIYRTSEGDFRRIDYRSLVVGDLYLSIDGSLVNEAVWVDQCMVRIIVERI